MLLLNGDCLELMKTLPDKSVDLFICDLPYGVLTNQPNKDGTEGKSKGGKHYSAGGGKEKARRIENGNGGVMNCAWDIKIDLDAFWVQVERLMKNDHTPIIQFCNTRFGYELIKSKEKWFRYDLVWSKANGVGFLSANKQPLRSHENIYVFAKKGATYYRKDIEVEGAKEWKQFGKVDSSGVYDLVRKNPVVRPVGTITSKEGIRCVKSVIEVSNKKGRGQHPTAKPVDLYKFLIERYSAEGDTILDPTFGSGNSGRASVELKRKYIGIEKDEKFFTDYYTNANQSGTGLKEDGSAEGRITEHE